MAQPCIQPSVCVSSAVTLSPFPVAVTHTHTHTEQSGRNRHLSDAFIHSDLQLGDNTKALVHVKSLEKVLCAESVQLDSKVQKSEQGEVGHVWVSEVLGEESSQRRRVKRHSLR